MERVKCGLCGVMRGGRGSAGGGGGGIEEVVRQALCARVAGNKTQTSTK